MYVIVKMEGMGWLTRTTKLFATTKNQEDFLTETIFFLLK